MLKRLIVMLVLVSSSANAYSPLGRWVTYDLNETPRTVIEIYETEGTLSGKVVKELNPKNGEEAQPICTLCEGDKKDKPKLDMVILWGLAPKGEDKWGNGSILDTDSGKVYSSKIWMDTDDKINFRAYVGIPLFGKTIVWTRDVKEKI